MERPATSWATWNPDQLTEWLRAQGPATDVVMSSRVRLARNLANVPFVNRATRAQRQDVLARVRECVAGGVLGPAVTWSDLHRASSLERSLLVERHLISQQHARGRQPGRTGGADEPRAVAFTVPDERVALMVNEEDHLRLQVITAGLDLGGAYARAREIDEALESELTFAFSPRFGYLTACPTNVGTGIRLSVMVHLPGLRLTGNLDKVRHAAADMSLAVRGFYGEGSEAAGDLYQISNQTTLGRTEEALLSQIEGRIIPRIVEYERAARRTLLTRQRTELEDRVFRALGTLTHARLITTEEAMQMLSLLRLGCVLGLVEGVDVAVVHRLFLLVQPAHVQQAVGQELDQDRRRGARASLLRTHLGRRT